MSNISLKKTCIYVYELPYTERKELCDIIDMNEKWEELGKYMRNIDTQITDSLLFHFCFIVLLLFIFQAESTWDLTVLRYSGSVKLPCGIILPPMNF